MESIRNLTTEAVARAVRAFRPDALASRHNGHRESRNSREWLFRDPICGSSRLRYNEDKQTWICWGCGRTGNAVTLVQLLERVDEVGALQVLVQGYTGGENRLDRLEDVFGARPVQTRRKALRKLPAMGLDMGTDLLTSPADPLQRNAWAYLFSRGVGETSAREFKVAYARFGRLRGYLVFPCLMDKKIVYWQGRATWDPPAGVTREERKAWVARTKYRKTLNPINRDGYATADEVIYNYDQARVRPTVVICEGPIDAMQVGPHAIATFGKSVSPVKIERMSLMSATHYVIYRDHSTNLKIAAEEAEGAQALAEELSRFAAVSIATPPPGRDAGSFSRLENARVIASAVPYRGRQLQAVVY